MFAQLLCAYGFVLPRLNDQSRLGSRNMFNTGYYNLLFFLLSSHWSQFGTLHYFLYFLLGNFSIIIICISPFGRPYAVPQELNHRRIDPVGRWIQILGNLYYKINDVIHVQTNDWYWLSLISDVRTNGWYWLRLSSPFPFLCLASAYLSNWQLHPEWVYVMIASKVSFIPMTYHPFKYIAADKGLIRCSPWRHTWRFASCLLYCPATINMGVREIREDFGCRLLCRHTHRRLR